MKKGFTLAEVLITLSVIGVVAALTMPSLIGNYKKQVYVTQLKKAVNVWDNGIKLMLAIEGSDYLNNTEFAQVIVNSGKTAYNATTVSGLSNATEILKKYFNIIKMEGTASPITFKGLDGTDATYGNYDFEKIYLSDGSVYYVSLKDFNDTVISEKLNNGSILIDVNGDKGPNQMGRDIFQFFVYRTGTLVAGGSIRAKEIWNWDFWKTGTSGCGTEGSEKITTGVKGWYCAARIIENGWEMDY
ncbi:MAG: type II secretion system GspH family protein [Heliobacteriaceae bacterium]|nr:type II secretion system GspH family protein [Heliobacteriaceae bacterium]